MAITDAQKVDYLYKKLGFGVAKTDTSSVKSPSNESIASPLLLRGDVVWGQSDQITSSAPAANTSVIAVYTGTTAVQTVNDGTASTNRTWKTNLTNWIGTEFGSAYQPRVWAAPSGTANAAATGTRLFPDGSGNNDAWFFDYQSGVLNFSDTSVPSSVTGNVVFVEGYRYIGTIGVTNVAANTANIAFSNTTITSSLTNGNITLDPTGTGNVIILGNTGAAVTTISSTQVLVNLTTNSTSTTTGALVVNGGVGIGGNLNVSGYIATSNLYVNGGNLTNVNIGNITFSNTTITTTLANGTIALTPTGTGFVNVTSTVASTNYTNGALVVAGGAGINGNLNVNGAITGTNLIVNGGNLTNVNIGNLAIANTTITTTLVQGNLTLTPTGNALVYLNTNTAVVLPVGTTAEHPTAPPVGSFRYNTDYDSPEYYNGTDWVQTTSVIDSQTITPDGTSVTYTLSRSTSTNGVLVVLNGVVQRPTVAYSVSGTQITFTEVPQTTDIIDIRFVAPGEAVSADAVANPSATYINGTATTIDTYRTSAYRTAKYVVQVSDAANVRYQSSEILVTHDGTTPVISVYGTVYTSSNLAGFTATISSGNVLIQATSTGANCAVKIQKTYIAS